MKNYKIVWLLALCLTFVLVFIGYKLFTKDNLPTKINGPKKPVKGTEVSTDFTVNKFSGDQEPQLLKNLGLCDSTIELSDQLNRPSCTANFFRFFPLKKNLDLSEGCMILLKAGVNEFPARRFIVYEKEDQNLIQANGFVGYPIEFRPNKDKYDDVVIRFFERYQDEKYFYNCLFTWKQNRYQFVCCEQINDKNIKPEKQTEVSAEILQILNDKKLLF